MIMTKKTRNILVVLCPLSPLNDTLIFSARTAGFQRTINIFFIPTAKQENKNISQRRHSWGSKRKSLEIQRNVMVNNKKNRLYQDLTGHLRNVKDTTCV